MRGRRSSRSPEEEEVNYIASFSEPKTVTLCFRLVIASTHLELCLSLSLFLSLSLSRALSLSLSFLPEYLKQSKSWNTKSAFALEFFCDSSVCPE